MQWQIDPPDQTARCAVVLAGIEEQAIGTALWTTERVAPDSKQATHINNDQIIQSVGWKVGPVYCDELGSVDNRDSHLV